MKKLRAAVLGVGYLGQFHAQKYKSSEIAELVGVFDASSDRAQKIAQDLKVKAFTEVAQLKGQVDLVTIAASTQAHYELAKWCLQNGIHVNVEKPITATLPQGEEIVALAKKQNLKLAVGHIERFNPAILEVKKKFSLNPELLILRREGPFKTRAADVSVLHDLMIHDVDLVTWLTGSQIQSAHVEKKKVFTSTWDWSEVHVQLKSGPKAVMTASRISVVPQRSLQWIQKDQTLWAHLGTLEIQHHVATPGAAEPVAIKTWTVEKQDALAQETESFARAVLEDKIPAVTGEDGLQALTWIEQWSR
ncbi:MAG: Gfo/Idh/MocA family oxidoreductase [Bdellovibrionales bacterium]